MLYKYELLLTKQTCFKVVRALWVQSGQYLHGWVRIITNGIKANLRPRCEGLFGPIGDVYLFDLTILWDITKTLRLHEWVFMISHIG